MDITMPVKSGIEATRELTREYPEAKVLIFTMHDAASLAHTTKDAGAQGLITKSTASARLTPALQAIIAGQKYFH
jgi:DNA-binding NarL/FixJ family response regulator